MDGPSVGIVVVSHSRALGTAAAELAREVAGDYVPIAVAAGLDDATMGTDAAAIATALNRPVHAEAETVEAWAARAREAGMGEYECATLAVMFRYYGTHGLIGNSHVLASLLGRQPADLAAFLHRSAARGEP